MIALCLITINMKRKLLSKEEKRVFEVKVRLNIKEKKKLESLMKVSEKNSAEIIRSLLMKATVPDVPKPMLDIQTYLQLKKIGVNYNQYVKAINQSRISAIDKSIMTELYAILQMVKSKIYSI
jgi:hypothetical protein